MNRMLVIAIAGVAGLLALSFVVKRRVDRGEVEMERTSANAARGSGAPGRDHPRRSERADKGGGPQIGAADLLRHRSQRPAIEPGAAGRESTGAPANASDDETARTASGGPSAMAGGSSGVGDSPSGTLALDTTLPAGSGSGLVSKRPAAPDTRSAIAEPGGMQGVVQEGAAQAEGSDKQEPVLSLFTSEASRPQGQAAVEENVAYDRDGARFNSDSEFAVAVGDRLTGEAGSISFWVRPDGTVDSSTNAALVQMRSPHEYENRLQVWQDGTTIRLVFADGAGTESGVEYASSSWQDGEWRQVTVAWGDGKNALYVNGNMAGEAPYQNGFQVKPDALLHIGSTTVGDGRSLNGAIQGFQLYDHKVTPQEVAALTAQPPR